MTHEDALLIIENLSMIKTFIGCIWLFTMTIMLIVASK